MKNSKIHDGLENKEIRDFLSLQMVKANEELFKNNENRKPSPYREDAFEQAITMTERELERLTKHLEVLKTQKSILTLIKNQGWLEFDVSDETTKDLPYTLKMNFIGTQQEYDNLLKTLNK